MKKASYCGDRGFGFPGGKTGYKVAKILSTIPKMPPQHSVLDNRLRNIVTCLTPAVTFLKDLHDTFGTPFITAIAGTTLSLMAIVQVSDLHNMVFIDLTCYPCR